MKIPFPVYVENNIAEKEDREREKAISLGFMGNVHQICKSWYLHVALSIRMEFGIAFTIWGNCLKKNHKIIFELLNNFLLGFYATIWRCCGCNRGTMSWKNFFCSRTFGIWITRCNALLYLSPVIWFLDNHLSWHGIKETPQRFWAEWQMFSSNGNKTENHCLNNNEQMNKVPHTHHCVHSTLALIHKWTR